MTKFMPSVDLEQILADAAEPGLIDAAAQIVVKAKANVYYDTGGYRRSLRVVSDRRGVVAETTDFAGHIIEWGSQNNTPQAPLRKAAADVGKFTPK